MQDRKLVLANLQNDVDNLVLDIIDILHKDSPGVEVWMYWNRWSEKVRFEL